MSAKTWSDCALLQTIPNPYPNRWYEHTIEVPEVTFLGAANQPDFGHLTLVYVAGQRCLELKSFKHYIMHFRDRHISYERFVNVVYDDLMSIFKPQWLKITVIFNARGGITSTLEVDSKAKA